MRGKPTTAIPPTARDRITPADAGKTALMPDGGAVEWDHPRGCGENARIILSSTYSRGSPPRMRGKLALPSAIGTATRITPADAGKTGESTLRKIGQQDHPRGCGENPASLQTITASSGSPPRMRGKLQCPLGSCIACRITPADAGKTSACRCCCWHCKDHPRGCGENGLIMLTLGIIKGSPPRMRGKHTCFSRN